MFIDRIPDQPTVYEAGRPIHIAGGDHAILILHGWTGWPGRLASVARALGEAGHTVHLPRMPGHGTEMRDMLQTGAKDWIRRAIDSYIDLRIEYDREHLSVLGTSMGAIMATIVAAKYQVPRVALLAPALLTRNPFIPLSPILKFVVPRLKDTWSPESEKNPLSREIGAEYASYTYVRMVAELYRMQRWGRRALRRLGSDTLVVASKNDQSVPLTVVDYIRNNRAGGTFSEKILEQSSHQLGDDLEQTTVAQAVVSWFADLL